MRQRVLETNPEYKKSILEGYAAAMKKYQEASAKFEAERAEPKKQDQTADKKPPEKPFWKPAELYNGMMAPLLPYAKQQASDCQRNRIERKTGPCRECGRPGNYSGEYLAFIPPGRQR